METASTEYTQILMYNEFLDSPPSSIPVATLTNIQIPASVLASYRWTLAILIHCKLKLP